MEILEEAKTPIKSPCLAPKEETLKQVPVASGFEGETDGSVKSKQENGVRDSEDDLKGGVAASVLNTTVVETGISVGRPFRAQETDEVIDDDVKKNGSSALEKKTRENGKEDRLELDSGENSGLEVKGERNLDSKLGNGDFEAASLGENGGDFSDSVVAEMIGKKDEEEGDESGDEEFKYLVGDFVWGKIKHHPWWPGQIYDPLDASEYALKLEKRERYLVGYFGDGTFAWCHPAQLKPFGETFDQFSKQSNSKSFLNAVEKALDEIGRFVESKMICSCVPKENQIGLSRPLAANAGIKEGVFVPEGSFGKLLIAQSDPKDVLEDLKYIAKVVSIANMLELTVLKSKLSAFYRAKGGYQLPVYHVPQYIVGLEDNDRSDAIRSVEFSGQVGVPNQSPAEEDRVSSRKNPGFDNASERLLQKCPSISEDKLYQRRKQKSIAEIMGGEMDVEPNSLGKVTAKEGTNSSKSGMTSRGRKKKVIDETEVQNASNLTSLRGRRKKTKFSGSPLNTENETPAVENAGGGSGKETEKGILSGESLNVEHDDSGQRGFSPRERKKSKYLSPPFMSIASRERNSSFKRDSESNLLDVTSSSPVGERISSVTGKILKGSDQTDKMKVPPEPSIKHDLSGGPSPQTPKQDQNKEIVDPNVIKAASNKVLSEIHCAALDLRYFRESNSHDLIKGFFSTFRSSIYRNGSNYKMYHKRRPGRKRKTSDSEPGSGSSSLAKDINETSHKSPESKPPGRKRKTADCEPGSGSGSLAKDINETSHKSPESKPRKRKIPDPEPGFSAKDVNQSHRNSPENKSPRRRKKKNEAKSDTPKLKQADGQSDMKTSKKGTEVKKASSETLHPNAASLPMDGGKESETSSLQIVKQKLELMTTMVDKSDGNMTEEMKSNLESELKELLEKVSKMD